MKKWSNLAKIVYRRTYARKNNGVYENWEDTVKRVIEGNLRNTDPKHLLPGEKEKLIKLMTDRKAMPAGRGIWYSGSPSHAVLGGEGLNNCWAFTIDTINNLPIILDMLMLGGGVGISVEHRYVSKLPKVKKNVKIIHKLTKDADYIVPDSREGWVDLFSRVLDSFFVTGKSFSYSTICIRGAGEPIKGFGGIASGPLPLIEFIENVSNLLTAREGRHIRPIDAADIVCMAGALVVAGNIRRSALMILGDPFDKEFLTAKRWDLGIIPSYRAMANWSVVVEDIDDVHPLFWLTYEHGEPFGIFNRKNAQKYGRIGELKKDNAVLVNPCAEATLASGESCNLTEIALPNLDSEEEFIEAARLMFRYGKRVAQEHYRHEISRKIISKNQRVGVGITGALASPLFNAASLDRAYMAIQEENVKYSKELGVPESIKTTVVKPSGTLSKVMDCPFACGIHGAYSRYIIQRIRFASNDPLIPLLKEAGHHIEPVIKFDGSYDPTTLVVDFYLQAPDDVPCVDEGFDTWKQLDTLLFAQRHWADQAVSVTVYYKKEDIPRLKTWLKDNIQYLKAISFLAHSDHGFKQAPWEAISKEEYEKKSSKIKELDVDCISGESIDIMECEGGACPIK